MRLLIWILSLVMVVSKGYTIVPFKFIPKQQTRSSSSFIIITNHHPVHHSVFPTTRMTTTTTTTRRMMISNPFWVRGGGSSDTTVKRTTTTTTKTTTKTTMAAAAKSNKSSGDKCPATQPLAIFGALWGSGGVVYILAKAIVRVLPIALEPFRGKLVLTPLQWCGYGISCVLFAYAEGYKGFHCKFAPMVVQRSLTLRVGTPAGDNPWHYLLAPLYSMGLFYATPKRIITSWSLTFGIALVVAMVKRLPPLWRCSLDAGVVVGLTFGSVSIVYYLIKSITTGTAIPNVDACLPTTSIKT